MNSFTSFIHTSTHTLTLLHHVDTMQAHHILDEMISNGFIVETNRGAVLMPIELLEKVT